MREKGRQGLGAKGRMKRGGEKSVSVSSNQNQKEQTNKPKNPFHERE